MFQSTPGAGGGGASGPHQRELVYRVRVVADTSQANQAFQQMGRTAQGAAAHYQQGGGAGGASTMMYMPGVGYVPGQILPPGGGGAGGAATAGGGGAANQLASLGLFAARLGTAVAFVTESLDKFQKVLDAVTLQGRETVNAQQKMEAWFNTIPVVGPQLGQIASYGAGLQERFGFNNGFGYAARAASSGRTQQAQHRMIQEGYNPLFAGVAGEFMGAQREFELAQDRIYNTPFEMARDQARFESRRRGDSLRDQYVSTSSAAAFQADTAVAESRLLFKGRFFGRTEFDSKDEFDSQIRAAERARLAASGGVGLARDELGRAARSREEAAAEASGGRAAYDAAQRRVAELSERAKSDPTIQGALTEAIAAAQQEEAKYAEQLSRYQKALNDEKGKAVDLAQQEYELSQRSLAVEQAKLSVVEQKLKQNDGYATSFAFMSGGQRQGLIDAARTLQEGDFDSLSPRQRELLAGSGITSDFLNKKARDFANSDNATRDQLDELVKLTGQQTRRELLDERNKLQAQIELEFVANPQKLAEALRNAFKSVDPELKKLIEESLRLEMNKIKTQQAAAGQQKK